MKLALPRGTINKFCRVFIRDTSQPSETGLTGLTNASAGLTWYWIREGDATMTAVSPQPATVGSFTSGGFKEVDSTNGPGLYELGLPNTSIASGNVVHYLKGAANMPPIKIEIQTDNVPVDIMTTGTGPFSATLTVDDGSAPIQDATVYLTMNSNVYSGRTDASGVVVLAPAEGNGTYGVQITAAGYEFTPTTLVVSGNSSATYSMTQINLTPSTGSGATGYAYTTDTSGNVIEGNVTVTWVMIQPPSGDTGVVVDPTPKTAVSDVTGLVEFVNTRPGAVYEYSTTRDGNTKTVRFQAGSAPSYQVKSGIC